MIGPIQFISRIFIDFFGITHPTPKERRQAEWFITGLVVLIVLAAAAVFFFILYGGGTR